MPTPFLHQALKLAEARRGFCAPNPPVGAVIVKDGKILSSGYHFGPGHPHAEVEAFNALAKGKAIGATLIVTLEPCCHYGRTPPCTERIIQEGIHEVIYGYQDPNPLVAGKGAEQLIAAGIACTYVETPEITEFYRSYAHWHQTGLSFITAKLALSLDGKIAGSNYQPVKITGEGCQVFTHEQRRDADAILTTAKTVLSDNPQLTVRLEGKTLAKPLYILDRHCRLTGAEQVFSTGAPITLFHDAAIAPPLCFKDRSGVKAVPILSADDALDLRQIATVIGQQGVHNLWIEAGGRCFTAFVEAGLVQRGYLYIGAKTLGPEGVPGFSKAGNIFSTPSRIQWYNLGSDGMCELAWY